MFLSISVHESINSSNLHDLTGMVEFEFECKYYKIGDIILSFPLFTHVNRYLFN